VPDYFRTLWSGLEPGASVVSVEAVGTDGDEGVIFVVFDHESRKAPRTP